jgi:hypothetical protein
MSNKAKKFLHRVRSAETWERADWFIRFKDPKELKSIITHDDWIPLFLTLIRMALIVSPFLYLDFVLLRINTIAFYVGLPLNIPAVMIWAKLVDHLRMKILAK